MTSSWPGLSRPSRLGGHCQSKRDARHIGERSDAVLRTSMAGHDAEKSLRPRRDGDQDRAHRVAAVDDLAAFVRADEAGIVLLEHGFLAVDDHRQFTFQHEIDLLGRRGVGPGAAAGKEVRYADNQALRAAGFGAEYPERRASAGVGRVVTLDLGEAFDLHQNASPFSMRYAPLGSVMATRRMIQPSPRSQFQGKNAKVQRLPVTMSRSPPTFSMPRMPFLNRTRCTGSHSGKSSFQSRPPDHCLYSAARCGCSGPLRCGPIAVASG